MTQPRGKLSIQVVGDVREFGKQLQADANKALRGIRLDIGPLEDQIDQIGEAGSAAFKELSRDAERGFDDMRREAARASEAIADDVEAAGERSETALGEVGDRGEREFDRLEREAKDAGGSMLRTLRGAALGIGAVLATVAAGRYFVEATQAAEDLGSAIEDSTQLIKATGAAAGLTAAQVRELSRTLGLKIGVDSVEVQQAANVLLTFRNVAGKTFGDAIGLAADLSAVLKTDLSSATLQIGKALNDPIRGVTALSRAGVQFNEVQREQIKGFVESGQLAKAQGIILAELRNQVGGVAEAGADITDKLSVAFLDLKREAGEALITFLDEHGPELIGLVQKLGPVLSGIGALIADALEAALPFLDVFVTAIRDNFASIGPALAPLAEVFGAVLSVLPGIIPPLVQITKAILPPLAAIVTEVASALAPVIGLLLQLAADVVTALLPVIPPLADALGAVAKVIAGALLQFLPPFAEVLKEILAAVLPLVPVFLDLLVGLLPLVQPLLDIVLAVLPLVSALTPLISLLVTLINVPLKILTPLLKILAVVLEPLTPLIELIAAALTIILKPLELLTPLIEDFTASLDDLDWGKIGKAIGGAFSDAWHAVLDFFKGIGRFFAELPGRVIAGIKVFPSVMVALLNKAFDAALVAVGKGIGALLALVLNFPGTVASIFVKLRELLGGLVVKVWQFAKERTVAGLSALVDLVVNFPRRSLAALQALGPMLGRALTSAWRAARRAAADGINRLVSLVLSVPGRIAALKDRMLNAGLALIRGFTSGLSRVGGFIGDVAGSIVNTLKSGLNRVIAKVNEGIAAIDDNLPFVSLPRIPQLAAGGLTTREGLANLHPSELVLPLEDRRAVDLLAAAMQEANASLRAVGVPTVELAPQFEVRVFVGDREISDIVRVEVGEHNRTLTRRVRAGSGRSR